MMPFRHRARFRAMALVLAAGIFLGMSLLLVNLPRAGPVTTEPAAEVSSPADPARASAAGDPVLSLVFTGDIMAHSENFGMPGDFDRIYDAVRYRLQEADLRFANLEFVVDPSRPYASYPRFNVHPEYVEAAIRGGFNVFSIANNHTTDLHVPGVQATGRSLQQLSEEYRIWYSGIRTRREEPMVPVTIGIDGRTVGFLAVTQFVNERPGQDLVFRGRFLHEQPREEFLAYLREEASRYDLFVLSYHGGFEYRPQADPSRVAFFRDAVDAGADIVWGHHSHVLQRWETHRRSDGSEGFIMHSTGNFISGQTRHVQPDGCDSDRAPTGDGILLTVSVRLAPAGPEFLGVEPVLLGTYWHREDGPVVRLLADLVAGAASGAWPEYFRCRQERLQVLPAHTGSGVLHPPGAVSHY
jgi:hypothetical protein